MGYTASDAIERIKLKSWTSTSSALTDAQLLDLLDDSLRSYIVPFAKQLRDEWFVEKTPITVTTDANGQVTLPDTVASTLRTVAWDNNAQLVPLTRVEPENAYTLLSSGSPGVVCGFLLRGYTLQVLPPTPGLTLTLTAMLRPAQMVLEDDAGLVVSQAGEALTLSAMPLAWQSSTPDEVDVITSVSPYSRTFAALPVTSVAGLVLTLQADPGDVVGSWLTVVNTNPFPNIPIELHPLLEQDVICTMFQGLGDKRLNGVMQRKAEMEKTLLRLMSPRVQGSVRPIVNRNAPGMNNWRRWW